MVLVIPSMRFTYFKRKTWEKNEHFGQTTVFRIVWKISNHQTFLTFYCNKPVLVQQCNFKENQGAVCTQIFNKKQTNSSKAKNSTSKFIRKKTRKKVGRPKKWQQLNAATKKEKTIIVIFKRRPSLIVVVVGGGGNVLQRRVDDDFAIFDQHRWNQVHFRQWMKHRLIFSISDYWCWRCSAQTRRRSTSCGPCRGKTRVSGTFLQSSSAADEPQSCALAGSSSDQPPARCPGADADKSRCTEQ